MPGRKISSTPTYSEITGCRNITYKIPCSNPALQKSPVQDAQCNTLLFERKNLIMSTRKESV